MNNIIIVEEIRRNMKEKVRRKRNKHSDYDSIDSPLSKRRMWISRPKVADGGYASRFYIVTRMQLRYQLPFALQ